MLKYYNLVICGYIALHPKLEVLHFFCHVIKEQVGVTYLILLKTLVTFEPTTGATGSQTLLTPKHTERFFVGCPKI